MQGTRMEHRYYVDGMHCASCEVLIEGKLLDLGNIKSVEASTAKGEVTVEYEGSTPSLQKLNEVFKKEGYIFSNHPISSIHRSGSRELFVTFGIGLLLIVGFIALSKSGLAGFVNVSSTSSLPMFFLFGFFAGISSCAGLVGGIILSMSKQWNDLYSVHDTLIRKIQPHLIFNAGRVISYAFFGAALGAVGSSIHFSQRSGSLLVVIVSVMMIFLALQMLGFKAFRKFQFTLPKFITRYIADESHFKGRHMPFLMGAFTFFLPCGFTITAQGLALISGSAIQGGLIMLLFALGTLPMLFTIGLSSVTFSRRPHLSARFLRTAGMLVLFFALYNINSQLNVFGLLSLNDIGTKSNIARNSINNTGADNQLPPIIDGKQIVKMDASSYGYSPNYFKVRVGTPVRWEITDRGTSGCTSAIVSTSLFQNEIQLTPGNVSVQEFTPRQPGKYKFSCWMGMVSGIIEVVGQRGSATQS